MKPVIIVRGLNHAFADRKVLDDLAFDLPAGSFFTIIGPNGSGKTTLLRLLAGLLPLGRGRIELLGRPINSYSPGKLARRIAYVPQQAPIEFPFTVTQVVLMGRAPHLGLLGFDGEKDLELARRAMAVTHVAHLAGRRMDQLSGGERQRVFIARAICQQPDIILLDEPTAALDLSHQVRVMDVMDTLRSERTLTVVMVSHDVNLAAMYADRMLLLEKGRKAGFGPPKAVLTYDALESVYGCALLVDKSPLGDYPRVHLVPERYLAARDGNALDTTKDNRSGADKIDGITHPDDAAF